MEGFADESMEGGREGGTKEGGGKEEGRKEQREEGWRGMCGGEEWMEGREGEMEGGKEGRKEDEHIDFKMSE